MNAHHATQALRARWQALSPREQRSLSALAALLGVWLFVSVAVTPALHTLRDSDTRRAQIGQQHSQMLALQAQAQALQTRTPLSRDEAVRNLQGLAPSTQIQLNVQGDRVSAQLKAVPAPVLSQWLAQARSQAQALPIEAHLTRNSSNNSNSNTAATSTSPAANATPAASSAVVWEGSLVLSLPKRDARP